MQIKQVFVSIRRDDGGVSILGLLTKGQGSELPPGAHWVEGEPGWWEREATDEVIFNEIMRGTPPGGPQPVGYRVVDRAEIPTDRSYRNAWADDGAKFGHDMPKARAIHLDRIRQERAPLLDKLDKDWTRAVGQGKNGEAQQIEAKRQALRDAPQTLAAAVDAAQDIEALKAIVLPQV